MSLEDMMIPSHEPRSILLLYIFASSIALSMAFADPQTVKQRHSLMFRKDDSIQGLWQIIAEPSLVKQELGK